MTVDPATLLYLNPQLILNAGLTTVSAVLAALPGLHIELLATSIPSTYPPGPTFEPRVYVAAQPDVSSVNATIRMAMIAMGLSPEAVDKRGVYVATIVEDVDIALQTPTTTHTFVQPVSDVRKHVRLQPRDPGHERSCQADQQAIWGRAVR